MAGSVNVAWFSLGPHPSEEGSAVIGGHFGIRNGTPFVFYNLDKLKIDDKVYIIDDTGATLITFIVRSLGLGATGADAVAPQSMLIEKGLLVIPTGVAKGFFGTLTARAVAKYQTLSGLPPVGMFGPQTRARFFLQSLRCLPIFPTRGVVKHAARLSPRQADGAFRGRHQGCFSGRGARHRAHS